MVRGIWVLAVILFCGQVLLAKSEDWSNLEAAKKTWFFNGEDSSSQVLLQAEELRPYADVNYFLIYQFATKNTSGWKVGKLLNYLRWTYAGPVIYKTMQVAQRPYREERVPVSVFYFLEKNGDSSKRIILTPVGDTYLYSFSIAGGASGDSSGPAILEFKKDFAEFSKTNDPFRGAVIEYNSMFGFLEGAEKLHSTWDQMILDAKLKNDLLKGIDGFLMNYDYPVWKKLGLPLTQGVLLSGAPGTGKSLVAKIIATGVLDRKYKSNFTYIHVQANNILSVTDVKAIYDMARYFGNTIVYFEDIDLIAGTNRFNRPEIKNELMQQLSGIEKLEGVLTVGTTNLGEEIDGALKRSQRLGLHYEFGPLLVPERAKLLEVFFRNKTADDLNLQDLAMKTDQFTGADLQQLFQLCFEEAFKRAQKAGGDLSKVKVAQADAESGLAKYKGTKFKLKGAQP